MGGYILIFIGLLFALIGILLFYKKKQDQSNQTNKIKMLGLEAQVSNSTLVIFIVGAGLIILGAKTVTDNPAIASESAQYSQTLSKEELSAIKRTIGRYYDISATERYDELHDLYDAYLVRFFNKYNRQRDEIIQLHKTYNASAGVKSPSYEINWESLDITKENNRYDLNFKLKYDVIRTRPNKPSHFDLKIWMQLNSDYKIVSIYEDILNKY